MFPSLTCAKTVPRCSFHSHIFFLYLHAWKYILFFQLGVFKLNANKCYPGKGLGASNAHAAKEHKDPDEAPVASDSGNSNVGVDASANQPGEEGIGGPNYSTR
jgi:hypothetical protein